MFKAECVADTYQLGLGFVPWAWDWPPHKLNNAMVTMALQCNYPVFADSFGPVVMKSCLPRASVLVETPTLQHGWHMHMRHEVTFPLKVCTQRCVAESMSQHPGTNDGPPTLVKGSQM